MSHTPNLALCLKCLPESPFKEMLLAEIEAIEQQRDTLLAALKESRATLERANTIGPEYAITDTIWHTEHETLFDFMDEAIASIESPKHMITCYSCRNQGATGMSADKDARNAELEASNRKLNAMLILEEPNSDALHRSVAIIAELERKLAEQQAYILRLCVVIDACHICLVDGDIGSTKAAIATINNAYPVYSTKELNNLVAKAKEEEREECAVMFEGQYTDSCPQTNISKEIRSRT